MVGAAGPPPSAPTDHLPTPRAPPMPGTHPRRFPVTFAALAGLLAASPLAAADPARAGAPPLPRPADVKALVVFPAKLTLKGADDGPQLVVTATLPDGRLQDLTGDV